MFFRIPPGRASWAGTLDKKAAGGLLVRRAPDRRDLGCLLLVRKIHHFEGTVHEMTGRGDGAFRGAHCSGARARDIAGTAVRKRDVPQLACREGYPLGVERLDRESTSERSKHECRCEPGELDSRASFAEGAGRAR